MADVHVLSVRIQDKAGDSKSMALYFPSTVTMAEIQGFADLFIPDLDDAIDGKILSAAVQMSIDLPAGLKATAADGNTVHEGALLRYDAANTDYTWSVFVPSWANANFAGNTVDTTAEMLAVSGRLVLGVTNAMPSDKFANDLLTYSGGERSFRK